ncbi:hypothetical protein DSO57_1023598 [Entomophthora muscae]|uniref:Uncharacterized protein n=3 Tax=Entomophthora muscae TaxID=34485 RepID=A0ACC2S0R5_9FUNG|nr:hypothetical protein DSO57_1038063 [Entomophthora muscae]KAJ9065073.1 hypothetical protein DSO57_1023597 [Entomophthora muscae]KAJ9065074.1 hypothetical protein DSO57_1023598 [Entomophthora muscae]
MRFSNFLLAVSSVLGLSTNLPVVFRGHPVAESTLSLSGTTLYINPIGAQQSGAQFPYDKKSSVPTDFSLATVYLNNKKGHVATLQTGFDTISQSCSCYWLDVKDLATRFPSLTNGKDYFISIEGDKYTVLSGTFALVTGKTAFPNSTRPRCNPKSK